MFSFLSNFFAQKKIDCYGYISLKDCFVVRPYLLEKNGIASDGTVCMLAIPYYTKSCDDERRNLSAYAVSKDYHLFYKTLFEELIPALKNRFPQYLFAGFADHSPINEIDAAARAGLGVIGKNHLLLTEKYSSYIFLGEIITDAVLPCSPREIAYCHGCGACQKNCPMKEDTPCLSALTQKKGELTVHEAQTVLSHGSVWGCDLCQTVCPYTKRAKESGSIYSPIPFFETDTLPHLTEAALLGMSEEKFSERAYSWRGRDTILRNLRLFEKNKKEDLEC